jgi:hypothetical protein
MIPKKIINDKNIINNDVLKSILFYSKVTNIKIFYDLFVNFKLNLNYINKIMKFSTKKSFNDFNCII